uniref:Uncharacterized protein n=1 Tax=Romanomermis culicivorax TaxID=13658 RepID=A0A915KFS3_ROMCU
IHIIDWAVCRVSKTNFCDLINNTTETRKKSKQELKMQISSDKCFIQKLVADSQDNLPVLTIIELSYDLIITLPMHQKNNAQFSTIRGIPAIICVFYRAIRTHIEKRRFTGLAK